MQLKPDSRRTVNTHASFIKLMQGKKPLVLPKTAAQCSAVHGSMHNHAQQGNSICDFPETVCFCLSNAVVFAKHKHQVVDH